MTEVWEQGSTEKPPIPIKVNGETVGSEPHTATLSSVASKYSSNHGLKTFNVLVNGSKADTSAGTKTLGELGATSCELVAKDARG